LWLKDAGLSLHAKQTATSSIALIGRTIVERQRKQKCAPFVIATDG
jgi:hypothetical protein